MRMRLPSLLLGCSGLAAARVHPYLYGVPKGPGPDMNEFAEVEVVSAADNNTSINSTQPPLPPPPAPVAPATPGLAEPCAIISSAIAALPTGARKIVPAELGMQCLQSVPLDKDGNMKLIDELKLYLAWQSNLAYLKNPPPEYTEEPVDIMGEINSMQKQLESNGYQNEYDFHMDLNMLLNRAYDNHLAWQPDILAGVMQFQRPAGTELVSVSVDGVALPEIFAYRDLELAKNDNSFKPSSVRTINGQEVEEYLQTVAVQADFHDADTRWNALFPSQALLASGVTFLGSFRTGRYQGPNTTMAFANGTVIKAMNVAVVLADLSGVDSGSTFFNKFCQGPQVTSPDPTATTTAAPTTTSITTSTPKPSHTGYPEPAVIHPNLSLGGYYLNDEAYDDVAILSIPSYDSSDVQLFQNLMRDFIRLSVKMGKTKLIFDLRGNGGGNAILGYDTFKQVFPQTDQEPFGATRYRANEAVNVVGMMTSEFAAGKTYVQSNQTAFVEAFEDSTEEGIILYTSSFNFEHQLDINNEPLESWEQMFGPERINADNFTKQTRYNFSDEPSYTYPGFSIIGYLNNTNETATPQPFKAENMVMLLDGMCSSTCTIISELLKNQGGIRTIAIGGRPQFGPMQGIGGTKGAQSFEWDDIQIRSQIVYLMGSPEQQAEWNTTSLGKTAFASQIFKRTAYAGKRPAGGINLRDNMRRDDLGQTPLEFIYEAADCRMWYTAGMVNNVTEVWKGVVDRMFRDDGMARCVEGSTGHESSVTGGGQRKGGEVPTPLPPVQQGGALKGDAPTTRGRRRISSVLAATLIASLFWI